MQIPLIYILISAEVIIILTIACVILGIYINKLSKRSSHEDKPSENETNINIGSTYIDFLNQEIIQNDTQTHTIEMMSTQNEQSGDNKNKPSQLLELRKYFLQTERLASELPKDNPIYWEKIYSGMRNILKNFEYITLHTETIHESGFEHDHNSGEKVFYIETQGKKIDGELNHLKDIIFDQENTVNGLKRALKKAEELHAINPEAEEIINLLRGQIENFERQLKDSKTCMDVLEMENNRLQNEVHVLEKRYNDAFGEKENNTDGDSRSGLDIGQLKLVLEQQERKITDLKHTIDSLKLEANQAEKLKQTLNDFIRNSREMMNCITILEEENDHMHTILDQSGTSDTNIQISDFQSHIKKLEEDLIKKDVAYAKLQDEFASMEKEYLAMYNAIHGNNG